METTAVRDYRQDLNLAPRTSWLLVKEFEKPSEYHETARDLALAVASRSSKFTDKEKVNLEIMLSGRLSRSSEDGFWILLVMVAVGLRHAKVRLLKVADMRVR